MLTAKKFDSSVKSVNTFSKTMGISHLLAQEQPKIQDNENEGKDIHIQFNHSL
jgi:hypothetical protein